MTSNVTSYTIFEKRDNLSTLSRFVPEVGIEPTLLSEHEFESCASTSSAIRARVDKNSKGFVAICNYLHVLRAAKRLPLRKTPMKGIRNIAIIAPLTTEKLRL